GGADDGPDGKGPAMQEARPKHQAIVAELGSKRVGGAPLKGSGTATTLRKHNGSTTLHDGPFAETKEQLGGFYLIDVPDLDAAISWAARCPGAARGAIEVRPIWTM